MSTTSTEALAHIAAIRQRLQDVPGNAGQLFDCRTDEPHSLRDELMRGRQIIAELRDLGDDDFVVSGRLSGGYRECVQSTSALRPMLAAAFAADGHQWPDADQVRAALDAVTLQIEDLRCQREQHERQTARLAELMRGHSDIYSGKLQSPDPLTAIVESMIEEALRGELVAITSIEHVSPAADGDAGERWQSQLIATHALNTAAVAARAFSESVEQRSLLLAALVADVGMLDIAWEVLAQRNKLPGSQRGLVQNHPIVSCSLLEHIPGFSSRVIDAVRHHHENPGGKGYPSQKPASPPLAYQLAACSVYAALRSTRPHRAAMTATDALTAMLLEAAHGALERTAVEAIQQMVEAGIGA